MHAALHFFDGIHVRLGKWEPVSMLIPETLVCWAVQKNMLLVKFTGVKYRAIGPLPLVTHKTHAQNTYALVPGPHAHQHMRGSQLGSMHGMCTT